MASGYKKYMKNDTRKSNPLFKIFIVSFFGMLLICTLAINYFSKMLTVDTSIGDYKEQQIDELEDKKIVDMNRLEMIQNEDQGKSFSERMSEQLKKQEEQQEQINSDINTTSNHDNTITEQENKSTNTESKEQPIDTHYKVYVGTYTSAEQARVAKEIILESGNGLSPIVKPLGSSEYTLQVGSFKNKQSAQSMLSTVQQNHLPGRIVQE